ncbi:MAG: hypothetical protein K2J81_09510, partial [Treponemataceae bacterium]|nr:hypothetical protein [Treponemataceae bacterium]
MRKKKRKGNDREFWRFLRSKNASRASKTKLGKQCAALRRGLGAAPQAVLGKVGGLEGGNPRFRVEGFPPSKSSPASKREEIPEQKKPPDFAALTRGKPKDFPAKGKSLEMYEDTARACVLCSVFCVLCSVFCV